MARCLLINMSVDPAGLPKGFEHSGGFNVQRVSGNFLIGIVLELNVPVSESTIGQGPLTTVIQEEAASPGGGVKIIPHDLPPIIDSLGVRVRSARDIDSGESTVVQKEAEIG